MQFNCNIKNIGTLFLRKNTMIFLSELKNLLNDIDTSKDDPKIVTRNRVGKEGRISIKKFGKDEIKYVERNGVEIIYDKENGILYIDS